MYGGGFRFSNMDESDSKVDELLKDPNSSIDDLLAEADIIQQFSYQTQKFSEYFTKDKIKQLVDFIIKEPIEDDQLKGHKCPYVAYQLLVDGETFLCNPFVFTEEELLTNEQYQKINKSTDIPNNENDKKNEKEDEASQGKCKLLMPLDEVAVSVNVRILGDALLPFHR